MVGQTNSYTNIQTAQSNKKIVGNSIVVGTTGVTIYTVPAGKVAIINTFSDQSINFGANTGINFRINALNLRNCANNETGLTSENINGTRLEAGDVISVFGNNAGNNGSVNWFIALMELPA